MTETVGAALRRVAAMLSSAGIEGASHEARLLLAHALGEDAASLVDRDRAIDPTALDGLAARRSRHEPIAHIVGRQGFWTLDLAVTKATLIPRADSETLIEAALAALPERASVSRVLDLGTGTGCLLLAALSEFRTAYGIGLDLSPEAAAVARGNAERAGLSARAGFVVGSWADPLDGGFDLVLSNPPYVARADIAGLMPDVALYEPHLALDGGPDGLDAYRTILAALPGLLRPQGRAVFEIGAGQAGPLAGLAGAAGLAVHDLRSDLGGIPRAIVLGWHVKKPFGTMGQGG